MKLTELRIDGYKNLWDCTIPLGDLNVVVGPNNSGKSNLLETLSVLHGLLFGSEEDRRAYFRCQSFPNSVRPELPRWAPHMPPSRRPFSMGISFETETSEEGWLVDYDLSVHFSPRPEDSGGFASETVKAKQPSKRGPAREYVSREGPELRVLGKRHRIPADISAFSAIPVLYPDWRGVPEEFTQFAMEIISVARTNVFALSPDSLRMELQSGLPPRSARTASFGLLGVLDLVHNNKAKWDELKNAVTHVLGLRDISLWAVEPSALMLIEPGVVRTGEQASPEGEKGPRFVMCRLQTWSGDWGPLEEFSDGTLIVLALLGALMLDDPTDSLTCIEELENCLHPSAQERLLRFLVENSSRWQTLVTTHSPYLVNGVDPKDVLVAVVNDKGQTHFEKPADSTRVNELLKSGMMSFGDLMATNFQDALRK